MGSQENETLKVKDRRDDFPVFIHSELDDYGLTPIEFRVYSRLARRAGQHGKHSESVPNMAKEFEVSDRTIQRALKLLVACALVARHLRPGKTDEYSLNPRSAWRNRKDLKDIRAEISPRSGDTTAGGKSGDTAAGGDMRDTGVVTPQPGVVVTPQLDEGTPSEGYPIKGNPDLNKLKLPELLPPFSGTAFLSALSDFEQHRVEKRSKLTPTARKKLYRKLELMGEQRATSALEHSTEQGYLGVFEPKDGNGNGYGTFQQSNQHKGSPGSDFQFKPKSIVR